jgi:hypothetical protein
MREKLLLETGAAFLFVCGFCGGLGEIGNEEDGVMTCPLCDGTRFSDQEIAAPTDITRAGELE